MMIRVVYRDGRYDMVKRWTLEKLIEQDSIQGFCRADGWVRIGRDRLRSSRPTGHHGEERRVPVEYPRSSSLQ
jgi:hypothetical protein